MYNLLKIGELNVDDHERPLFPPKVISVDVLWNPFDDMIPRITAAERQMAKQKETEAASAEVKSKEAHPKKKKNLAVLSFADEEDGNNEGPFTKVKSLHDVVENDSRMQKGTGGLDAVIRSKPSTAASHSHSNQTLEEQNGATSSRTVRLERQLSKKHEASDEEAESDDSDAGPSHKSKKGRISHPSLGRDEEPEHGSTLLPSESAK